MTLMIYLVIVHQLHQWNHHHIIEIKKIVVYVEVIIVMHDPHCGQSNSPTPIANTNKQQSMFQIQKNQIQLQIIIIQY